MFVEDQEVVTPMGHGFVLEQAEDVVFVELDNGVEVDFLASQVRDHSEVLAEEAAKRDIIDSRNQAHNRVMRGAMLVNVLLADMNPNDRATVLRLMARRMASDVNLILDNYKVD